MRLGSVHFDQLSDDGLEDVYLMSRALARDIRAAGCYGLANLLKAFVTECALELNVRDARKQIFEQPELFTDISP